MAYALAQAQAWAQRSMDGCSYDSAIARVPQCLAAANHVEILSHPFAKFPTRNMFISFTYVRSNKIEANPIKCNMNFGQTILNVCECWGSWFVSGWMRRCRTIECHSNRMCVTLIHWMSATVWFLPANTLKPWPEMRFAEFGRHQCGFNWFHLLFIHFKSHTLFIYVSVPRFWFDSVVRTIFQQNRLFTLCPTKVIIIPN